MSLLQEIYGWAQAQPAWQRDAISRLLAKQTLTTDDVDDLYALLKVAHGIKDSKGREPHKFSADQIPAEIKIATHVELRAVKNLKHVNAIAANQRLPLGAVGLTVI